MGYGIDFLTESFEDSELISELQEELKDEYEGAINYAKLSALAEDDPTKYMLTGMARDEYRHAKIIELILTQHNVNYQSEETDQVKAQADMIMSNLS